MLTGSPGCGKSQIVHQIAQFYNLKVIDVRLSQCDPTDLSGFPHVFGNKAGYLPMNTFPIEGDEVPQGYDGWLLFFDEFNSASKAVQAAAYKVVLDRMIGIYHLHKKVALVCAGNLDTDNAIVESLSTALQSRLVHLELMVDHEEWNDWAIPNNINHYITDYIKFKPGQLFSFKPDHTDKTYACPRTWEFANRILQVTEDNPRDRLPALAGALGEGVAREFLTYLRIYDDLPKPAQIVSDPSGVKMPVEPSILFALTGTVSHNANDENWDKLMTFIKRMPDEFQVVTVKDTLKRNKKLVSNPATIKWIAESKAKFY